MLRFKTNSVDNHKTIHNNKQKYSCTLLLCYRYYYIRKCMVKRMPYKIEHLQ